MYLRPASISHPHLRILFCSKRMASNGHTGGRSHPSNRSGADANSKPPAFREKLISFSVDLVEAARRQLVFIKKVDQYRPSLYSGPMVAEAIRRYEMFWLPLLAEADQSHAELCGPIDVEWVWHVHLLAPLHYKEDTYTILGRFPNHQLLAKKDQTRAYERARSLWSTKYPHEPFDTPSLESLSARPADDPRRSFHSKLSYDLAEAISRQRWFCYQVSLPHYREPQFLKAALVRYKKYLFLKRHNPSEFLVPCYDMDLIWHSHQLHPLAYEKDTKHILGRTLNHDDSVNDRSEGSKLCRSDRVTRDLWRRFFREEFAKSGAMFRGEPPADKLSLLADDSLTSLCTKVCRIRITSVNFEPGETLLSRWALHVSCPRTASAVLSNTAPGSHAGNAVVKLRRPQTSWEEKNGKAVAEFSFNSGMHRVLAFELIDKRGCICASNEVLSSLRYPLTSRVEARFEDSPVNIRIQGEGRLSEATGVRLLFQQGTFASLSSLISRCTC